MQMLDSGGVEGAEAAEALPESFETIIGLHL
jgi:hypothetical protein